MKLAAKCETTGRIGGKVCFEGSVSAAASAGFVSGGVSGCFESCVSTNFYKDNIYMMHLEVTPDNACTSECFPGMSSPSESLIA